MATTTAKYGAEFLGTFLLTFVVGLNSLVGDPALAAFSIASTLMVLIYTFGGVSGGHFNPAVTVGVTLCKPDFAAKDMAGYVISQVLGGLAAAGCYGAFIDQSFNVHPVAPFGGFQAVLAEMFFTGFLVFCVLNCALPQANQGNEFYGLCIGFSVIVGAYSVGAVSGACLNPAVALGNDLASISKGFGWSLWYLLGELAGACLAAVLYRMVRPEEFGGVPGTLSAKLSAEFIGTFFLCLTVGCNQLAPFAAENSVISCACALMCAIYCVGSVSGAHLNPAVTTAIACSGRNKISAVDAVYYVISQFCGGFTACVCAGWICDKLDKKVFLGPHVYTAVKNAYTVTFTWWGVFLAEAVFTFILCYCVLAVATNKKPLQHFYGLAIGFCVIIGGYAAAGISGGVMNPAVALAITMENTIFQSTAMGVWRFLPYMAAQLVGGAASAACFMGIHAHEMTAEKGDNWV